MHGSMRAGEGYTDYGFAMQMLLQADPNAIEQVRGTTSHGTPRVPPTQTCTRTHTNTAAVNSWKGVKPRSLELSLLPCT